MSFALKTMTMLKLDCSLLQISGCDESFGDWASNANKNSGDISHEKISDKREINIDKTRVLNNGDNREAIPMIR